MGKYIIHGGRKLEGSVNITGSKNAILPILAASVLNSGVCIIDNCPKLSDVFAAHKILKSIGCRVEWDDHKIIVDSSFADSVIIPEHLMREMRSSVIFLGSILARFNKAKVSFPGGCELGPRPIDLHLKALRSLGVTISEENGYIVCETTGIKGCPITLDFPSVGATENIMLASTFASGKTVILNAAREPEIVDLQNFLNEMGAQVYGAGTDTIIINGVKKLKEARYKAMPDRIVAGTYLTAAAITGGKTRLNGISPAYLNPVISKLEEVGCKINIENNSVHLESPDKIKPIDIIRTHPHPGFPTDMQPQFMSLLTLAEGTSIIIETVFESRFKHAPELNRMGANISTDNRAAVIKGTRELYGSVVSGLDLRGGAALILAGLAARGKTEVLNSQHVERGYEKIELALSDLGADIEYVES